MEIVLDASGWLLCWSFRFVSVGCFGSFRLVGWLFRLVGWLVVTVGLVGRLGWSFQLVDRFGWLVDFFEWSFASGRWVGLLS